MLHPQADDPESDAVTLVTTGEGATSEGEFWESLNVACLERLPVLYLVEDNGYAISVPVEKQTAGGNIARLVGGFPNLQMFECDGTDFLESYRTMRDAVEYCRRERAPVLVHATCTRPYSHSLSDDEKLYKPKAERDAEAARDPLVRFPEWLLAEGILDTHGLEMLMHEVDVEIQQATANALKAAAAAAGVGAAVPLFGPRRSRVERIRDRAAASTAIRGRWSMRSTGRSTRRCGAIPRSWCSAKMWRIAAARGTSARSRARAACSKPRKGCKPRSAPQRVFNTPIAEACIVGRATGMATRGLKPVVEIQFFDYIWPAMMQIRDELATLRWRSYNGFSAPVVIRVAIGGYLNGGAIYHSQCGEVDFHAHSGIARGVSVKCAGRLRAAAHGHPLRRSGSVSGTQEAVPRSRITARRILARITRFRSASAKIVKTRRGADHRDLWRAGAEVAASGGAGGAARIRTARSK